MNKRETKIILLFIILTAMGIIFKINNNISKENIKGYKIVKEFTENFEKTSLEENEKIIIKKENKFGIIDLKGNKIKDTVYDYILRMEGDLYFLQIGEEKKLCNVYSGTEINVEEVTFISNGLYKVMYNDKYGIVDKDLNVIIEIENDFIDNNQESILIFNGNSIDFYNANMEKNEIKEKYQKVKIGIGEYLFVQDNGLWGIADKEGNLKTKMEYNSFLNLNEKDILVGYKDKKSYLINLKNGQFSENEVDYENYGMESADKIMVLKDGKIGYIDIFGKEIIPLIYDGGFMFDKDKDFIQVKNGEKWELLDKNGVKFKELSVKDIGEYKEGYMLVEENGKYGYIDNRGNIKIPVEYDFAYDFNNGLAVVAGEYGYGVIDKENLVILPLKYDEIQIKKNYICAVKNNGYGLYSYKGKEILKPEYDYLNEINDKVLFFRKDDISGFIELEGEFKDGNQRL